MIDLTEQELQFWGKLAHLTARLVTQRTDTARADGRTDWKQARDSLVGINLEWATLLQVAQELADKAEERKGVLKRPQEKYSSDDEPDCYVDGPARRQMELNEDDIPF
jgi:hypothetical protein